MKEDLTALQTKVETIQKGLDWMGKDRARALSQHETDDLIESLRALTAELLLEVKKLGE